VALAFPQIEEGAFATSPIPPDIVLPVGEIPAGKKGTTRDQGRVWLDEEKTGTSIDSNSATVVFVGTPSPKTEEIMETDFLAFLSLSSAAETEISFGISGAHASWFGSGAAASIQTV